MSATVLYMSTSLDGFIAGPNETPENGLGDGGHRLHQWSPNPDPDRKVTSGYLAGVNRQVQAEAMATGAVVAGRGTFEPAGGWDGDHHDGVPIFILTRHDPRRSEAMAARQLPERRHERDDSSQGGRGRQERHGPGRRNRAARDCRRRPRGARAPCHP